MNCLEAAQRFNQHCPKGGAVEVALRSGEWMRTKTAGPAFVWAGLALVELEGTKGPYEVEHVRPLVTPASAGVSHQAGTNVA